MSQLISDIQKVVDNIREDIDTRRPDWDEWFMSTAMLLSTRSSCERLPVGAIVVKDNRIIATGYNGFLPGFPHKSYVKNDHEQNTIHAEDNALTQCGVNGISCQGATVYTTHFPCHNCTKSIINHRIAKVVYLHEYKKDPESERKLQFAGIDIKQLKSSN